MREKIENVLLAVGIVLCFSFAVSACYIGLNALIAEMLTAIIEQLKQIQVYYLQGIHII